MVKIVSVKFASGNKPYYFAPGKDEYEKGMGVIVETAKGLEYATVLSPIEEVDESRVVAPLKPVVRIATDRDKEQVRKNAERRDEAMAIAREKIAARELEMKLTGCEFSFDGNKVTFYFTSETRVDFRELIKDLSAAFHMRIELRQIGIRDEIKMMGGIAPCGRECCCSGCMAEPKKVSVKMAKNQGLSLNPSKISGLCGRLMCCLSYENDYYCEVCKQVPKIGSEVETPDGVGTAVNVNMLKMTVKVKIEKNDAVTYKDYGLDEIRFMRGNVVMGGLDEDDPEKEDEELLDEDVIAETDSTPRPKERHERPKDRHNNNNGNGGQGGNGRPKDRRENNNGERSKDRRDHNGQNGNGQRKGAPQFKKGEKPAEGAQPEAKPEGENRSKKRFKHRLHKPNNDGNGGNNGGNNS